MIEREVASAPDVELRVPLQDEVKPTVTVLIPALNECLTVVQTVEWCLEGFRRAGLSGEVIIVDSSDDGTAELALEAGARVLRVPRRGLGRAYLDAIPFVRAPYVIVGDADCTYDFRELGAFVAKLEEGYDFVMGSRFRGSIEPRAMPLHHRYFGTPVTNFIFNRVFSTKFSDIHCGMRAITLDAYRQLDLRAQGWEYASEMIIKAVKLRLRCTEVPIAFYRDREGRISNVKRGGWKTSWLAGWRSLQVIFTAGPEFFLLKPSITAFVVGFVSSAILSRGPVGFGSLHTLAIMMAVTIIGAFGISMGVLAKAITDPLGTTLRRLVKVLRFDRTSLVSGGVAIVGAGLVTNFVVQYARNDWKVTERLEGAGHLALFGVLIVGLSFVLFTTMLITQGLGHARSSGGRSSGGEQ